MRPAHGSKVVPHLCVHDRVRIDPTRKLPCFALGNGHLLDNVNNVWITLQHIIQSTKLSSLCMFHVSFNKCVVKNHL